MSDRIHETEDPFLRKLRLESKNPALRELSEEVSERKHRHDQTPETVPRKLSVSEFNTALVHFYRGEIQRSNTWRRRLDTTTNWAVITAGATLSFVFSSASNPHFAIPINTILVTIFLFMEARRYRYYEVWANRVRAIEAGYFGPMLSYHCIPPDTQWAEHISEDLLRPKFPISVWKALGMRLRANYAWIFGLLALSWGLKVYIHPVPATHVSEFIYRAHVGLVPGWIVIAVGVVFNLCILAVTFGTIEKRTAAREVEPDDEIAWQPLRESEAEDWTREINKENEAR